MLITDLLTDLLTELITVTMESMRKFLRECIVRKVKDDVEDFGDVFGNNVLEYYVDKDKIDKKYDELCEDRKNDLFKHSDDIHALMFEAVKWLHEYHDIKPYHVYLVWYACRVLMLNGLTPATNEQVTATYKQCDTEFAKCFSRKDDYMELVHPCSDYVRKLHKNSMCVSDDELLDGEFDSTERYGGVHVLKVRAVANKILRCANTDYTLVHKKWLPSDVPYGLHDYLYNGEYNVQNDDEDDDTLYRMLYEYEMYVNNRNVDVPRCDDGNHKVSYSLYDWRHYKPATDDEEENEVNDVLYSCVQHDDEPKREITLYQEDDISNFVKHEDDYMYRTTIKFVVSKKENNYTCINKHFTIKLASDELNKLADYAAETIKTTVNASMKF